jgi:hypothetical protein
MALLGLLALAPACGFSSSGGGVDAGSSCFGSMIRICFDATAVPAAPRVLGGIDIDVDIDTDRTASGFLCDQNNDQRATYCVVTGAPLTLSAGATLTAHGDKPLVLLSTTTMELLGDIDVSSHRGGRRGPGATSAAASACSFMTAPTGAAMGGGGYGASLGTVGGSGGNAGTQSTGGGVAGSKLDTLPRALRGGCKGGDGSLLSTTGALGVGGDGGGAIALVAGMQIHVDAKINASGGGGQGGAMNASNGGGGGGAGGMIVFDSPLPLTFGPRTRLWANGGGGAQGGDSGAAGVGGGESIGPMQAASGGSGGGIGGAGGNGSAGSGTGSGGATAGSSDGGGGGGGGGAGFIHAPGFTDLDSISPPSSDPG